MALSPRPKRGLLHCSNAGKSRATQTNQEANTLPQFRTSKASKVLVRRKRACYAIFEDYLYALSSAFARGRPSGNCQASDAGAAATARHLGDAPASPKLARGSRQKNSDATALLFCWGTTSPPPERSGGNLAFARKRGSRRFYRWGADDLHPSAKSPNAALDAAFRAVRAVDFAAESVSALVFGQDKC